MKRLVLAATVALILLLGVTLSIPVLLGSGAISSFMDGGQSTGVGDLARQDVCGGAQTCLTLEAYLAAARLCPGLERSRRHRQGGKRSRALHPARCPLGPELGRRDGADAVPGGHLGGVWGWRKRL
jgi:hypothetical protein